VKQRQAADTYIEPVELRRTSGVPFVPAGDRTGLASGLAPQRRVRDPRRPQGVGRLSGKDAHVRGYEGQASPTPWPARRPASASDPKRSAKDGLSPPGTTSRVSSSGTRAPLETRPTLEHLLWTVDRGVLRTRLLSLSVLGAVGAPELSIWKRVDGSLH
jgi:hypothetical protein